MTVACGSTSPPPTMVKRASGNGSGVGVGVGVGGGSVAVGCAAGEAGPLGGADSWSACQGRHSAATTRTTATSARASTAVQGLHPGLAPGGLYLGPRPFKAGFAPGKQGDSGTLAGELDGGGAAHPG